MKRLVAKSWAIVALLACAQATPMSAAEREWRFDVSLDGKPIGEHRYVLREGKQGRELTSDARFRVRVLFLDAYRYEHRAHEWWQGDCLERLEARTDANGEHVAVRGEREGTAFRVTTGGEDTPLDACVQTFAYWNRSILDARRLLNPQTGEYVEVQVLPMGRERVGGQPTERFKLLGRGRTPLEIDLWYTAAGDWMALESLTPQGRVLRYSRK